MVSQNGNAFFRATSWNGQEGRGRVSKPIKRRSSWVWCNCCTSNHSGRALSTQRDSFCRVPTILYLGFFGWSLVHVALLESSHWSLTTVRSGGAYVKGTIIVADPREGSGGAATRLIFKPNWGPKVPTPPPPTPALSQGLDPALSLFLQVRGRSIFHIGSKVIYSIWTVNEWIMKATGSFFFPLMLGFFPKLIFPRSLDYGRKESKAVL